MRRVCSPAPWSKLVMALALALGPSLVLAPVAFSGEGTSGANRGDGPVVGSLPCMVDPSGLDSRYYLALGLSGPPVRDVTGPPMLGFIGPPALGNSVIEANGTPYGWVNRGVGWTVFSLTENGYALFPRVTIATAAVTCWQWVPLGYVGGTLTIQRPNGTERYAITAQAFPLNLAEVALAAGSPSAVMTIAPPDGNSALGQRVVRVTSTPATIRVEYTR